MTTIPTIISDLKFGRSTLLKSLDKLSHQEMTQKNVYTDWTIKDILAHVIGWDQRVINTLPLMLQDRANEISGVVVDEFNHQAVAAGRDKTLAQIKAEIQATHQQIINILSAVDLAEIDKRHDYKGRTITIRNYVIEIMLEHERRHALEIEQWQQDLEKTINPQAVRQALRKQRAEFMTVLDRFNEDDVLDKSAVGVWSITDLAGHVADWEQTVLATAQHIYDPSQPLVSALADTIDEWNALMVAARSDKSWPETYHYLRRSQHTLNEFILKLNPGDWRLRGPYPWSDYGSLAELVMINADHYLDHLPDLNHWHKVRYHEF